MKQHIQRLAVSASAVVLLGAFSQPALADACMTGVTVGTTNVVSGIDVGFGTALTSADFSTTETDVVDSVTQTKNSPFGVNLPFGIGFVEVVPGDIVVTDVASTTTSVLDTATLTTGTGQFVNSVTPAFTEVVNSVTPEFSGASGNGATAFACGQNATATGPEASAFGNDATAFGAFTTALGGSSSAFFAFGSTAVGAGASVDFSLLSTATGAGAQSVGSSGSTATGALANTSLSVGSTATGAGANAFFSRNATATGAGASASLSIGSTATGAQSNAALSFGSTATGAFSDVSGTAFATASGFGSEVAGFTTGGTAIGAFSSTSGNAATAIGTGSEASANATAVGAGTSANANGSVAIGRDSSGDGAVASQENEFVMGTANHTYTTPGITSDLSRDRQSGPLEVVTTDANGHLASDGGQIFRELGEQGAGIAIATALENPDLVGGESFGLAANIGFFEGNSALAVAAMGVLGHNFMGGNERWAISGGVGISLNENNYGGQNTDRTVAGRAGIQVSW